MVVAKRFHLCRCVTSETDLLAHEPQMALSALENEADLDFHTPQENRMQVTSSNTFFSSFQVVKF